MLVEVKWHWRGGVAIALHDGTVCKMIFGANFPYFNCLCLD